VMVDWEPTKDDYPDQVDFVTDFGGIRMVIIRDVSGYVWKEEKSGRNVLLSKPLLGDRLVLFHHAWHKRDEKEFDGKTYWIGEPDSFNSGELFLKPNYSFKPYTWSYALNELYGNNQPADVLGHNVIDVLWESREAIEYFGLDYAEVHPEHVFYRTLRSPGFVTEYIRRVYDPWYPPMFFEIYSPAIADAPLSDNDDVQEIRAEVRKRFLEELNSIFGSTDAPVGLSMDDFEKGIRCLANSGCGYALN